MFSEVCWEQLIKKGFYESKVIISKKIMIIKNYYKLIGVSLYITHFNLYFIDL